MSDFKRLAHAVWECKYHLVWCPKYRFRILEGEIGKSVGDIIKQLCEWKKIEILEHNNSSRPYTHGFVISPKIFCFRYSFRPFYGPRCAPV